MYPEVCISSERPDAYPVWGLDFAHCVANQSFRDSAPYDMKSRAYAEVLTTPITEPSN